MRPLEYEEYDGERERGRVREREPERELLKHRERECGILDLDLDQECILELERLERAQVLYDLERSLRPYNPLRSQLGDPLLGASMPPHRVPDREGRPCTDHFGITFTATCHRICQSMAALQYVYSVRHTPDSVTIATVNRGPHRSLGTQPCLINPCDSTVVFGGLYLNAMFHVLVTLTLSHRGSIATYSITHYS